MRGIRARLTVTLVALVALTAILLGAGAYLFVESEPARAGPARRRGPGPVRPVGRRSRTAASRLDPTTRGHRRQRPARDLPPARRRHDHRRRRRRARRLARSLQGALPSVPGGPARRGSTPASSPSPGRRSRAGRAWSSAAGRRAAGRPSTSSTTSQAHRGGARAAPAGPDRRDARPHPRSPCSSPGSSPAASSPRSRPPAGPPSGSSAATCRRACRSPRTTSSARGRSASTGWPRRSADTIGRLEAAEAQNRRFVADVAHELRTPLAALVAEASILREHLDALPADSRRAGELLVADVGRLRSLVDDLMEVSRFDARAEQIALEPVDLGRLVATVVAARLPEATLDLPDRAARDRDGPAPARADPRQPARQRPRARRRRRRSR